MKLHEWTKSFETGHAVLDAQHRGLVKSLNKILTLSSEENGEQAFAECIAFRKMTREHFEEEVEILRQADFPRLEAHAIEHDNLLERFEKIFSNCNTPCKDPSPSLCPCMEDMSFLTIDHLVRYDLDYKSHLQTVNMADDSA